MKMNNRESVTFELLVIRLAQILAFVPVVNLLLAAPYFSMQDFHLITGMLHSWFYFIISLPITIGFGIFKSKETLIYGIIWNLIFLVKILGCSFGLNPIPMQYILPLYFFSSDAVRYFFLSIYVVSIIIYFVSLLILSKTDISTNTAQVP